MSFWTSAWNWATSSGVVTSLAKTAALGFAVKLMSDNVNKDSNTGSSSSTAPQDSGARIQLNPDPQNKIPVLYGSAFFGGNITDVRLSADQKTITYCLALAEQTGNKINGTSTGYIFEDLYLNNNRVVFKADGITVDYTLDADGNQDISMRDLVKVYMYAAGPKQPVGYSATTPAAHTVMPGWTAATHPMTGLIYAIVSVTYNRAKNVVGLPDCKFHLTSDMTLPGDVLRDYMTSTRYGAGIPVAEIDNSLTALNDYCDTGFTYVTATGISSTAKITINGLVDTSNTVMDVMEELAAAANSWVSYNIHKGQWTVVINKEGSAVATLDDGNIIGEISIGGTSLTQLNNIADVKYQNARILDKEDYVKVSIPAEDLFQNEPRSDLQINLPYTNKQAVALRIGLQQLKQARVDKIINFATDYSYINITAGDIIGVTSPVFGYNNKLFRVITVAEEEGDDASLQIRFTCLEYDADVYVYDITEFEVETQDGILNIGSIGKPGTPQISKFERDARPRVKFESVSPSGIVEGLEFWITNDVSLPENQRSYRLLSTRYPNTSVTETWAEGTNVVYEDDALPTSDFYVKTRGINALVVGPFSDVSGLIQYVPEQVTDGIGPDTKTFDATGGLLTALALVDLLKLLDELYSGISGNGSLFDKIFEVFEDVTGIDLVGEAAGGELVVKSDIITYGEGELLTSNTASYDFVGEGVMTIANGNNVTVQIDSGGAKKIDDLTDVDTSTNAPGLNDLLRWDGTNWVPYHSFTIDYELNNAPQVCPTLPVNSGWVSIPKKPGYDVDRCNPTGGWHTTSSYITYNYNGTTTNYSNPSKTGSGPFFVTYVIANTNNSPKLGLKYTVSGISPSGYNGSYECVGYVNGQFSDTITLKYPTDPGTYSSGGQTVVISGQAAAYAAYPNSSNDIGPLYIKENTASSYTLKITPSNGSVPITFTADNTKWKPNSISGGRVYTGLISQMRIATSDNPVIIVGNYNSINTILQSGLRWYAGSLYGTVSDYYIYTDSDVVNMPPPATSTVQVELNINGVISTWTKTMNYSSSLTPFYNDFRE